MLQDNPISVIFDKVDLDYLKTFNSYRILKDNIINLKRLKYYAETFNIYISVNNIKKHYEVK